jgi:hypothetical protein
MTKITLQLGIMWDDFRQKNPQAARIYDLFVAEGETVQNDHIALRTFNCPNIGIEAMARVFVQYGYREAGQYRFPEKHLIAKHYEHSDPTLPKIFISELELGKLSLYAQKTIRELVAQIPEEILNTEYLPITGRLWEVSHQDYLKLSLESEYAGWVSAWGFRPNHFTVSVNHLKKYNTVQKVNQLLETHGFKLNVSGGAIKGTPADYLEQSSTMSEKALVDFSDVLEKVPACFYEFALRYPMPDGKLFQGFVPASANKIFESTYR